MLHDHLPKESDVMVLLGSLATAITLPAGFDVQSKLNGAVTRWNEGTLYRPFFQTSATPVARPYDPPGPQNRGATRGGSPKLLLGNGLLSLTSLFTGVDTASSVAGTQLVEGEDFWLYPGDARVDNAFLRPYTEVQFVCQQWGLPRSIVITGVWGYCHNVYDDDDVLLSGIPDDAWQAILQMASADCLQTWREGLLSDVTDWKEADSAESYNPNFLMKLGCSLEERAHPVMLRYRNLSF